MTKAFEAVNWDKAKKETLVFYNQMRSQFWVEDDIPVSRDLNTWATLDDVTKQVFVNVLSGLTLLDTLQASEGMTELSKAFNDETVSAVLRFMSAMEDIHAKSYSNIFGTLLTVTEREKAFESVKSNPLLQQKAYVFSRRYKHPDLKNNNFALFQACVASVFLESFAFYSGFYLPLWLKGNGKMSASGEMIRLIVRDEAVHGAFVGMLAQNLYKSFDNEGKKHCFNYTYDMLANLFKLEERYTRQLYAPLGDAFTNDVINFAKYNACKALNNLGFEAHPDYQYEEFSPIVLGALDTGTVVHDYFSGKGNSYIRAVNVTPVTDSDFIF